MIVRNVILGPLEQFCRIKSIWDKKKAVNKAVGISERILGHQEVREQYRGHLEGFIHCVDGKNKVFRV